MIHCVYSICYLCIFHLYNHFIFIAEELGKLTGQIPMPTDLDFGIAFRSNVKLFREANWHKLKAGLICQRCLCQSHRLTLGKEKQCLLYEWCKGKKFRRYVTSKHVSSKIINFQFFIFINPCFFKISFRTYFQ